MTDLKTMELILAINDKQEQLIKLEDKKNEIMNDLLDRINQYIDWANETIEELGGWEKK